MATKRIEATIPFTYLIPETTPEEKIYFYFKETHTSEEIGQGEIVWGSVPINRKYYDRPNTDAVDVEFDGQYYKNVPLSGHELGERVNGEISFENYPFFVGYDNEEIPGTVYTQTEGNHTLGFPALPSQVVRISFASVPESTIPIYFNFDYFVENNSVARNKNRTLMPGESAEAIVLKGTRDTLVTNAFGTVDGDGNITKVSGSITLTNHTMSLAEGTEGTITALGVK